MLNDILNEMAGKKPPQPKAPKPTGNLIVDKLNDQNRLQKQGLTGDPTIDARIKEKRSIQKSAGINPDSRDTFTFKDPFTGKPVEHNWYGVNPPTQKDADEARAQHVQGLTDSLPFHLTDYYNAVIHSSPGGHIMDVVGKDGKTAMSLDKASQIVARTYGVDRHSVLHPDQDNFRKLASIVSRRGDLAALSRRADEEALNQVLPDGENQGVGPLNIPISNEGMKQAIRENPNLASEGQGWTSLRDAFWWLNSPASTSRQLHGFAPEDYTPGERGVEAGLNAAPGLALGAATGGATMGEGLLARAAATAARVTAFDAPQIVMGVHDAGGLVPFAKSMADSITKPLTNPAGADPADWVGAGLSALMLVGLGHGLKSAVGRGIDFVKATGLKPSEIGGVVSRAADVIRPEITGEDKVHINELAHRLQKEAEAGGANAILADPRIAVDAATLQYHSANKQYVSGAAAEPAHVRFGPDRLAMGHDVAPMETPAPVIRKSRTPEPAPVSAEVASTEVAPEKSVDPKKVGMKMRDRYGFTDQDRESVKTQLENYLYPLRKELDRIYKGDTTMVERSMRGKGHVNVGNLMIELGHRASVEVQTPTGGSLTLYPHAAQEMLDVLNKAKSRKVAAPDLALIQGEGANAQAISQTPRVEPTARFDHAVESAREADMARRGAAFDKKLKDAATPGNLSFDEIQGASGKTLTRTEFNKLKVPKGQEPLFQKKNASYKWDEAVQRGTLTLNKTADASSLHHELSHHFLQTIKPEEQARLAHIALGKEFTPEQAAKMFADASSKDYKIVQETFARSAEYRFLHPTKKASDPEVQDALDRYEGYMRDVYGSAEDFKQKHGKEVNAGVMDYMDSILGERGTPAPKEAPAAKPKAVAPEPEGDGTGLARYWEDAERGARGLDPTRAPAATVDALAKAGEKLAQSTDMDTLLRSAHESGRNLEPGEIAAAAHYKRGLMNDYNAALKAVTDGVDVEKNIAVAQELERKFGIINDLAQRSRTEFNQIGRALQVGYEPDYSLATILAKAKVANLGEEVTGGMRHELENATSQIASLSSQLSELKAQLAKKVEIKTDRRVVSKQRALSDLQTMGFDVLYQNGAGEGKPRTGGPQTSERFEEAVRALARDAVSNGASSFDDVVKAIQKHVPAMDADAVALALSGKTKSLKLEMDVQKSRVQRAMNKLAQDAAYRQHSKLKKLAVGVGEVVNATGRTLKASVDMSAPFVQGLPALLSGDHAAWGRSFVNSLKGFTQGEHAMEAHRAEIANHPMYAKARKAGLRLTDGVSYTSREELFNSAFTDTLKNKLGGPGKLVAAFYDRSEANYTMFLNQLRFDMFNRLAGLDPNNPRYLKDIANMVNITTGSGTGKVGEFLAHPVAGKIMFAPRYTWAKFQNVFGGTILGTETKAGRLAATKKYAAQVIAVGSILGLAKMFGAKVDSDARSQAFGSMELPDGTTIAPFGQLLEPARFFAQMLYGKESTNGVYTPAGSFNSSTLQSYITGKFAPVPRTMMSLLVTGTGYDQRAGESTPLTSSGIASDVFSPIAVSNVAQNLADPGMSPTGKALSFAEMLGLNVGRRSDKFKAARESGQLDKVPEFLKNPKEFIPAGIRRMRDEKLKGVAAQRPKKSK